MPKSSRFKFSVRTLLCLTLVAAGAATWFRMAYVDAYRQQAEVLQQLDVAEGAVLTKDRQPKWLWSQFGEQIAQKGTTLELSRTDVGDMELADIGQLTELGGLYLDETKVTDAGLQHLENMKGLIALGLRKTSITKCPPLSKMSQLQNLDLGFTQVEQVDTSGLRSLVSLNLRATRINDKTLANLSPLPNLESLDIAGSLGEPPRITDEGLAHLRKSKYPKLKTVYLYDTKVSPDGVARLKAEFPGIKVMQ